MSNDKRHSRMFLVFISPLLTLISTDVGLDLDSQLHITNNFLSYPDARFFSEILSLQNVESLFPFMRDVSP